VRTLELIDFDRENLKNKRTLICGSREWDNLQLISKWIIELNPSVVIEGAAPGADSLAAHLAKMRRIPVREFPANWEKFGKAAGPIRNNQMLLEGKPDVVLAFHKDLSKSKGTKDMVTKAKRAALPIVVVSSEDKFEFIQPLNLRR
jgi:hypothetical protein